MISALNNNDWATGKRINKEKPEGIVRQDYERVLVDDYGYQKEQMEKEDPWKGLSAELLGREKRKLAEKSIYGIDKEMDLVKITNDEQ